MRAFRAELAGSDPGNAWRKRRVAAESRGRAGERTDCGNPRSERRQFGAQRRAYITLWDEDGLSADDEIGNFSFDPLDHYENDNRAGFYEVFFGTNSTKVSVTGTWIY